MRLILFFSLLLGVKAHETNVDKDFSEHGTIVKSKVVFVALGFDATLNCDALDALESVHVDPAKVHWRRLTESGTVVIAKSTANSPSTSRFYYTSHEVMYLLGAQMVHNNTVVECHVEHEEEQPQNEYVTLAHKVNGVKHEISSNFSIKEKRSNFVSRIKIVVQDCGVDDETKSRNDLNPCQYGVCLVNTSTAFHRLQCMCVEQYTGEYCEVLVDGTYWREMLFYSPVLAHLLFVILFTFHQCCMARTKKVRKTALEDVLDKSFADKIDMKRLYPAVYYDKKDLEEMTQSEEDYSLHTCVGTEDDLPAPNNAANNNADAAKKNKLIEA